MGCTNADTALQRRLEFERGHPDVGVLTPLTSPTGQWEATWDEGNGTPGRAAFGHVEPFLTFLTDQFGA
jgi:hypothetical protein